jgi:GNAT superfamily N-acetyltransferase
LSTDPASPPGWWHCRGLRADGSVATFTVCASDRHADGTCVDVPQDHAATEIGDAARCVAELSPDGRVTTLAVQPGWAPKAPPLWFAELDQPEGTPPSVHLLAFSGHDVAPGTLLDRVTLRDVAVRSGDQLAALHWFVGTGEIDQVYVAPAARRRQIATALLMAAGTLAVARGWARLWSDGQRTALGDRLAQRPDWTHRAADLTHLAPPMTPPDQRDESR